jgi:hypothetical protein
MRAGRLRVLAGQGIVGIGVAALAGACSSASSSVSVSATPTVFATPTVTPSSVPLLGKMTMAPFLATPDGEHGLVLCEQWAQLRGQYVSQVKADTPNQLDLWFSGRVWAAALSAERGLATDPLYSHLSAAFGTAVVPDVASIANARQLDAACAAGN